MDLYQKIDLKKAAVGIIGLGYVGLPLVLEFCKAGFSVTGFDIDAEKIASLRNGKSYIEHLDLSFLFSGDCRFEATENFLKLSAMDCIIICVPTPLNKYREPNLSYVLKTSETIAKQLRPGQLVVLESTTYPGTTDEEMRTILERNGLKAGKDFYLAYSPEREDPGNRDFNTHTIPKVVGGYTPQCLKAADSLYRQIVAKTIPVSSTRVAECSKLLENIYRAVNIALVNELKVLFDKMDIDIWEVIDAAKTKPFGFHAFYPGPGLGGHCIPIDPFYLTWKAREYDSPTKFIELAGEVNTYMPHYVVEKTISALNECEKSVKNARILILGLSYKQDVDDVRESPAFKIIQILENKGAIVDYHDPHVPVAPCMRHYSDLNKKSIELNAENLRRYDCAVVVTAHSEFDPEFLVRHCRLLIDTRNIVKTAAKNVKKA